MPTSFSDQDELVLSPEAVLDTRYNQEGKLEASVAWRVLPPHETSWEIFKELQRQFPFLSLEDKLVVEGRGVIDRPHQVWHVRRDEVNE